MPRKVVPSRLRLVLLSVIGLMLIGLAAVAQAAPAKAPEERIVKLWYSLPAAEAAPLDALVTRFNATNRHSRVETRNFASMDELHAALASGAESPHLALIDSTWQHELIAAKRILPAEDFLTKMGTMARIILKADTFPGMWEAVLVDGKCWSLPAFATCHALLYDTERLQGAGIKVPPKNWWEVVVAARKMTNAPEKQWGFLMPTTNLPPRDVARLFQVYRLQAGAAEPAADSLAWLDGPECVTVLQHWLDIVHKHKAATVSAEEGVAEKAAMYVGTVRDLLDAHARGRKMSAVPLPAHKAQAADITVYTMAIFPHEDRSMQDQIWHAGLWLTEFQQMLEYAMVSGYIPANKQITLSPGYFQYLEAHPGLRSFLAQLRNCHVDPMFPGYTRSLDVLGEALKKAVEANGPAQDVLTATRQKAEVLLKPQGISPAGPSSGS